MIKGITARKLLMEFPYLKEKLYKGHLWNPSYYIETIGSISEDVIRKYIKKIYRESKEKMSDYTYRFRLYPKKKQIEFLNKQIGHCRFAYNRLLEIAKERKDWDYYKYKKLLPELKKAYPFLKEANSQSLQEAVKNLDRAFKNFFEGRAEYPRFRKKKHGGAVSIPQHFKIYGNKIRIPKLSTPIRFIKHREIEGTVKSVSISKTPTGKFYLNVLVEKEMERLPVSNKITAVDVGLTHFCTLLDGSKIESPKYLIKSEEKLKKIQRQLSRKQKGSRRWEILRRRIARLHEKIKNQRNDFLHKLSKRLIGDNQAVVVENLNVKGMLKNHRLAKHISDSGWQKFISMLEYKANFYGRKLIKVNTFYPSSKLCHVCGYKNSSLTLSDREWTCPICGTRHDRDVNAALNLLRTGLASLNVAVGTDCPELMPAEGTANTYGQAVPNEAGSPLLQ